MVMLPVEFTVTLPFEVVKPGAAVLTVPALTKLTSPPIACSVTATLPVFDTLTSPALARASSKVVAAVRMGPVAPADRWPWLRQWCPV